MKRVLPFRALVMTILLIVIIVGITAYTTTRRVREYQKTEINRSYIQETQKTYTFPQLGVTLQVPATWVVVQMEPNVKLGFIFPGDDHPDAYLTITSSPSLVLSRVPACTDQEPLFPCHYPDQKVDHILVDGHQADSLQMTWGVDALYQIVQLTDIGLEFKMNVSGGGLERTFTQILASTKIHDK